MLQRYGWGEEDSIPSVLGASISPCSGGIIRGELTGVRYEDTPFFSVTIRTKECNIGRR
jgi:hypothetical protein